MSLNVTVGALSAPHVLPRLNMARGRLVGGSFSTISPRNDHIWRLWGRCIAVLRALLYWANTAENLLYFAVLLHTHVHGLAVSSSFPVLLY